MSATRLAVRTIRALPRALKPVAAVRSLHATRPAFVRVGDSVPSVELMEGSPGTRVNLADEAAKANRMLIIGVPAAFSPSCSASHVPSYIVHPKTREFDVVAIVSVNDVFVMKAWGEVLDPAANTPMRFLADPSAKFTKALDLTYDGSALFGGDRSRRYALVIEKGKVQSAHIEPDNTGTNVSMAEKVLGAPNTLDWNA